MASRFRVWGLTAAAVVVVVFLGVGAYLLGAGRTPPQVGGSPVAGPSSPTAVVPVPVTPAADPLRSATVWLRGYRTQSWTDPQPWSWTVRVAPVVTGGLAGQYRTVQSAAGGAEWADYIARRCATQVSGLGAVVPAEAPRSDTEVYVQVTGDAVTQCGTGPAPGGGTEHLAATVELVRGGDGLWRVTNRLY